MKKKFLKILAVSSLLLAGGGVITMNQMHDGVVSAEAKSLATYDFTIFNGKDDVKSGTHAKSGATFKIGSDLKFKNGTENNYYNTNGSTQSGKNREITFTVPESYTATISITVRTNDKNNDARTCFVDTKVGKSNVETYLSITSNNYTSGTTGESVSLNPGTYYVCSTASVNYDYIALTLTSTTIYSYDVKFFDGQGENGSNGTQIGLTQSVEENGYVTSVPADPTHSDFAREFLGWSSDGGTTKVLSDAIKSTPVKDDINYVACWSEPQTTIDFTIYDYAQDAASTTKTIIEGHTIEDISEPAKRDGFEFYGYYSDSNLTNKLSNDYVVTANSEIYAKWVSTVGVNLAFNGATYESETLTKNEAIFAGDYKNGDPNKEENMFPEKWDTNSDDKFANSVSNGYNGTTHAMKLSNSKTTPSMIYKPAQPISSLSGVEIYASFNGGASGKHNFTVKVNGNETGQSFSLTRGADKKTVVNDKFTLQNVETNVSEIVIEFENVEGVTIYLNAIILHGEFVHAYPTFNNTNSSLRFNTKLLKSDLDKFKGETNVLTANYTITDGTTTKSDKVNIPVQLDENGFVLNKDLYDLKGSVVNVDTIDGTAANNYYYKFSFEVFNIHLENIGLQITVDFDFNGKKVSAPRTMSVRDAIKEYKENPPEGMSEEQKQLIEEFAKL